MLTKLLSVGAMACCLSMAGCSKPTAEPAAAPAQAAADGKSAVAATVPASAPVMTPAEVFTTRCVPCHGATGKGDGPGSAALNPKPRDYTDPAWQDSVTDEQIKKTILYGGAAVGKSPIMPAQPDLESKPELLDGVIKVVRGFRKS